MEWDYVDSRRNSEQVTRNISDFRRWCPNLPEGSSALYPDAANNGQQSEIDHTRTPETPANTRPGTPVTILTSASTGGIGVQAESRGHPYKMKLQVERPKRLDDYECK